MNNDLMQKIQTVTEIIGLITIFLLWWQITNEAKWKKINISIDKINSSLLKTNGKIISDFGINMEELKMSDEDFNKLTNTQNFVILFRVQEILDMFENFATLYNMDAFNKYYAYEAYSETIIQYYARFERIIDYLRNENDIFYYQNFEKCVNIFIGIKERKKKIFEKKAKNLERIKRKIDIFLEKYLANLKQGYILSEDKL